MTTIRDTHRRRGDPAVLLRRLERLAHRRARTDAGCSARLGASRLARTRVRGADRRRRPRRCTARCRASRYEDYAHAQLIVLWGVNPSATGIHLVPVSCSEARDGGAKLVVVDPRGDAARPTGRSAPRAAARAPTCRSRSRCTGSVRARPRRRSVPRRAHARRSRSCASAPRRGRSTAPRAVAGVDAGGARRGSPSCTPRRRPRSIRCGWGLERNRNGGSAAAAVLALPAVARQVRRARRRLHDEQLRRVGHRAAAWRSTTPEPPTRVVNMNQLGRALHRADGPAGRGAVRLQLQPARDRCPIRTRVLDGLDARGSVHRGLRAGDDRHRARTPTSCCRRRRSSSTTTSRRGYGPHQPAARAAGHRAGRRGAPERRGVLAISRAGWASRRPEGEPRRCCRIAGRLPAARVERAPRTPASATPPFDGAPVQFVDVFPLTPIARSTCFPKRSTRMRPPASTASSPIPAPSGIRSRSSLRRAKRPSRPRWANCASARRCCRCILPTHRRAASQPTTPSVCSTISAKCSARSR